MQIALLMVGTGAGDTGRGTPPSFSAITAAATVRLLF